LVDFKQTGESTNRFEGPLILIKNPANPFDQLGLRAGVWTNETVALSYTDAPILRDLARKTNYFGPIDFVDGDPATPEPDYVTWTLSIDDTNDADGDGIPDFSDDPNSATVKTPLLSLTHNSTNLLLSISGTVSRIHEVQETAALSAPAWNTVVSVRLTNDPQTVALPVPAFGNGYLRVRVP
jgi:hypothetical protein